MEILNPIMEKDFDEDKLSILDIRACDEGGRLLNIEVQRSRHAGLAERLTYYAASLDIDQLGEGDEYALLNPAIGVCVLDDLLFPDVEDLHLDFRLRSIGHYLSAPEFTHATGILEMISRSPQERQQSWHERGAPFEFHVTEFPCITGTRASAASSRTWD